MFIFIYLFILFLYFFYLFYLYIFYFILFYYYFFYRFSKSIIKIWTWNRYFIYKSPSPFLSFEKPTWNKSKKILIYINTCSTVYKMYNYTCIFCIKKLVLSCNAVGIRFLFVFTFYLSFVTKLIYIAGGYRIDLHWLNFIGILCIENCLGENWTCSKNAVLI